jgi:hypothetical protein
MGVLALAEAVLAGFVTGGGGGGGAVIAGGGPVELTGLEEGDEAELCRSPGGVVVVVVVVVAESVDAVG